MSIRRLLLVPLFALLGLVVLAAPALAKVTIVPGAGKAGETATFAFRVANQQTNANSTRVELVFPQDKPITYAEVDPVRGWTATINPRPLPAPIQAGDKTITEAVGSIVLDGGSVGPGQFEQFLITLGPLPTDGTLSFDVTQAYSDGRSERWTGADAPGITITSGDPAAGAPVVAGGNDGSRDTDSGAAAQDADGEGGPALTLIWVAIGLGIVIIAGVGIRARLQRARTSEAPEAAEETPEQQDPEHKDPEQKDEAVEVVK